MKQRRVVSKELASLPANKPVKADLVSYLEASTKASGVPLKLEDAGTLGTVVTLVRSATRAK